MTFTKRLLQPASLLLVLLLTACATSPRISTDADPSADFSRYSSFAFYEPLAVEDKGYSTPASQRLKAAVRQQMESRGYVYDETKPDLLVNISAYIERREDVINTPHLQHGLVYNYAARNYVSTAFWVNRNDVYRYTEGTLGIDLVEAGEKRLVWEGVAVGRMANTRGTKHDARIAEAVADLFAQYPHRAGTR